MTSVLKVDNIQNSSGTSALEIDSSGILSIPNLAGFKGYGTPAQNMTNPSTDIQTLTLNTIRDRHPSASYFSVANNEVTVTKGGFYLFSFAVGANIPNTGGNIRAMPIYTTVNDTITSTEYAHFAGSMNTATTHHMFTGTSYLHLNDSDGLKIQFRAYNDTGSNTTHRNVQLIDLTLIRLG